MSNPLKRLFGQTAIYGLSSIVGRTLNYLLVPLYTHVFADPSDYGVVSELYAWVAFLIVFLTFGMETTFFRFIQDHEGDKETVFRNSFFSVIGINAIFFLLLIYFNEDIADLMLYSGHNEYIILLGAIVCIDAISALPLAKLRAEEKALKFAGIQFAAIGVNILINLVLMLGAFDPERPEEGVLFILFANLFSSLMKPLLLYKDFMNISFRVDKEMIKRMLWYALPLVVAGFAGIINETLDRILLKHMLYDGMTAESLKYAEGQVGIYSACYKLAMLVSILLQAYRYAAEPFFFAQLKNEDKNKIYAKVMNFFIAAVALVFLVVSLNIDIFKLFIRNESYYVGLGVVPILLLANVFLGIYFNQSIWYKLSGQTKYGAYIAIVGATLTILINVIFIPYFGYFASAWATLIVYASQMVLSYYLGQKHYPIKYNLRKFGLYLGSALLIYLIASLVDLENGTLKFVIHNILILGYIGMIYSFEKKNFHHA
jgi:O-antigen/teichoic acid export membrane protein